MFSELEIGLVFSVIVLAKLQSMGGFSLYCLDDLGGRLIYFDFFFLFYLIRCLLSDFFFFFFDRGILNFIDLQLNYGIFSESCGTNDSIRK